MKTMSKLFVSLVLIAALMAPASAGTIYCGLTAEPSPTPSASATVENDGSTATLSTTDATAPESSTGSVINAALMVLQSVLSII